MAALRFRRDGQGRPHAEPADPKDAEAALLAAFLTEEVRWRDYAGQLLRMAEAGLPDTATGNAYAVDVAAGQVTVSHMYLPDHPRCTLATPRFATAMRAWLDQLDA